MNRANLESLVRGLVEEYLAREQPGTSGNPSLAKSEPGNAGLKVITESEVREAGAGGTVLAASNAIVTAAAEDLARAWNVTIHRGEQPRGRAQTVAVGADHAGYAMKEKVIGLLQTLDGFEPVDVGTHSNQPVDYPDFAHAVAEAVATGKANLGIVIDGAGIGSAMAANKVPGIRAAMCYDALTARNSREHNFANILTLGARLIDEARMHEIVKAFVGTATGEERHAARVRKVMEIEKKYRKG